MANADSIFKLAPSNFISSASEKLKSMELSYPKNHDIIKLSVANQHAPLLSWFETRLASTLRKIAVRNYNKKTVSVEILRSEYGMAKNRGVRPSKHAKGSRYVVVSTLNELKRLGLVEENKLVVSEKGLKFIEEVVEKKE